MSRQLQPAITCASYSNRLAAKGPSATLINRICDVRSVCLARLNYRPTERRNYEHKSSLPSTAELVLRLIERIDVMIFPLADSPCVQISRIIRRHLQGHVRGAQLVLLALLCAVLLTGGVRPALADSWHYGVVWGADWVDLDHPGIHTHQNKVAFNIRRLYMRNPSNIHVIPHCELWTWTPHYGSIENWTVQGSGSYAVVLVPSRFVDALYFEATGPEYYQSWPYYAEVWWYGP